MTLPDDPAGSPPPARPPAATGLGLAAFVTAWERAVAGTSYVPMTPTQKRALLRRLAERLAAALLCDPVDVAAAQQVGADLVTAHFATPEALGRTVALVHSRLLDAVCPAGPALINGGLAGGQANTTASTGCRQVRAAGSASGGPASSTAGTSGGPACADDPAGRLTLLVEALTSGYTRALCDRALAEQESIRAAAMLARQRAEQALRASEARFRHGVLHDPLTGLPNRARFTERLEQLFAQAGPGDRLGLCFIDLDHFQAVNDSLGHRTGDRLLIAVADRLARRFGSHSRLVARLGGDEFAILIDGTTCADDAVKIADRALVVLQEPVDVDGHELPVTASAGVVERALEGTDPSELMRAADITLHWAKSDGRARWRLFADERNASDVTRYRLSAAMPRALSRDEFVLHYQPLVDLGSGALRGVEALARWRHPTRGLLGPDHFIGLAEHTGLIVPLGLRLLEQACRQAVCWGQHTEDPPFVSVNLAARQIRHPGLIGQVMAVLDRTGLAPTRLQLEITESAVVDGEDTSIDTLRALGDLGIRIAIDDFGTGYANLAYLRNLPVHELKLASTFVRGLDPGAAVGSPAPEPEDPDRIDRPGGRRRVPGRPGGPLRLGGRRGRFGLHLGGRSTGRPAADPTAEAILTALVRLARALDLTVTAEGIETAEQAERLRELGCDTGQGWYFGRPEPDDQFIHRLPGQLEAGA